MRAIIRRYQKKKKGLQKMHSLATNRVQYALYEAYLG